MNNQIVAEHTEIMERVKPYSGINLRYSTKNWSAKYRCPICGREIWQNLNFLGNRELMCVNGKSERW
jgi:hypothetical protein